MLKVHLCFHLKCYYCRSKSPGYASAIPLSSRVRYVYFAFSFLFFCPLFPPAVFILVTFRYHVGVSSMLCNLVNRMSRCVLYRLAKHEFGVFFVVVRPTARIGEIGRRPVSG